MPRPRIVPAPEEYLAADRKMAAMGHRGYCGPLAIHLLTKAPVEQVLELCAKHGRKPKEGMNHHQVSSVFQDLGFTMIPVNQREFIDKYPKGHREAATCITTHHPRRFRKAFQGQNLFLHVRGHFVAIVNGVSMCWAINKSLRVKWAYRLALTGSQEHLEYEEKKKAAQPVVLNLRDWINSHPQT